MRDTDGEWGVEVEGYTIWVAGRKLRGNQIISLHFNCSPFPHPSRCPSVYAIAPTLFLFLSTPHLALSRTSLTVKNTEDLMNLFLCLCVCVCASVCASFKHSLDFVLVGLLFYSLLDVLYVYISLHVCTWYGVLHT